MTRTAGHVARLLERAPQRDRALELAVVVQRRVGAAGPAPPEKLAGVSIRSVTGV